MIIKQHVPAALIHDKSGLTTDSITLMLADAEEDLGDNVRSATSESVNEVSRDIAIYHVGQISRVGAQLDGAIRHTFQRLAGRA
jgi:hypothetical protein